MLGARREIFLEVIPTVVNLIHAAHRQHRLPGRLVRGFVRVFLTCKRLLGVSHEERERENSFLVEVRGKNMSVIFEFIFWFSYEESVKGLYFFIFLKKNLECNECK